MNDSLYSIENDESCDNSEIVNLLIFVHFIHKKKRIIIQISYCKEIPGTTFGEDIFNVINDYMMLY